MAAVTATSKGRARPKGSNKTKGRNKAKRGAAPDTVHAALAAFAHEVRTPLTGILAITELLATSNLDEREHRWVDTIRASADHLSALATLFVDAARSATIGLEIRHDPFDLQALASMVADSLAGRAAAKGLKWSARIAPTLPEFVAGDPVRLRAALENLIDNAVKFTEHGSVELTVRATRRPGGRVEVRFDVSDSGIGLSLAEVKRLFRPFSQANVQIAARYGGATFTLSVMLDRATAPVAPGANGGERPAVDGRRLHLLSVEDNPFGRVVLKAILTELGHQVDFAGGREEALTRMAQARYDAVLMDMVLPDSTGVEVIRSMRGQGGPTARIPIIGVSGRGDDETQARDAGADAFLVKPVSPRALATALLEATRRGAGAI